MSHFMRSNGIWLDALRGVRGMGNSAPQASVIIATWNRRKFLQRALESLEQQTCPQDCFEVIVVDNASTDDTADFLADYILRKSLPLRVFREERLGISFARNAGVKQARGNLLLFLDDDARADPDWIVQYLRFFAERPADIAGGKILPDWEVPPPDWMNIPAVSGLLSLLDYGSQARKLTNEYVFGANFAMRKKVFEQLGAFCEDLGRKGADFGGGEETELQDRVRRKGGQVWYCPEARVYHWTPQSRLQLDFLIRRSYGVGRMARYISPSKFTFLQSIRLYRKAIFRYFRYRFACAQGDRKRALKYLLELAYKWGELGRPETDLLRLLRYFSANPNSLCLG